MSVATIEDEVRKIKQDEIEAFTMPKPCLGQSVTWFHSGTRTGLGEIAWVLKAGHRNIVLQRASGLAVETVRHVADPKLQLSVEQRESGAWDFTDQDKKSLANEKLLAELVERVKTLEEFINEPVKKKADKP
jgi:hypothetical protein